MADRYEDRERHEGGRSQDAGRRNESERGFQNRGQNQGGNRGNWGRGGDEISYGDYGSRGSGFGYGGEGWQDDSSDYGSGRNEARYGNQGQYGQGQNGDDYDRGVSSQSRRGMQSDRQDWDRHRERSMTQTYPRRDEWSSGSGVSTGLGGHENTEYSNFRGSGSYYGGQGQFGRSNQYGGGISQYGSPGMGGYAGSNERGNEGQSGGMGWREEQGRHSGRGPKGYKRSDERIKEDVNERLTQDAHIDAGEIEVQVKDGEVTLTGMVDNRSTKRRAEDIIENVSGVREIHNQLRVQSGQTGQESSASSSSGSNNRQSNQNKEQATSSHQTARS